MVKEERNKAFRERKCATEQTLGQAFQEEYKVDGMGCGGRGSRRQDPHFGSGERYGRPARHSLAAYKCFVG